MQKVDYSYKSYILNHYQKLIVAEKRASLFSYSLSIAKNEGVLSKTMTDFLSGDKSRDYETYQELKDYCKYTNLEKEFNECAKINHATFQRTKRLKERISYMLHNFDCAFLTLTFKDQVFQSSNYKTRRTYVARFLKELGAYYIANVDYGKKNGREHYHAIVGCVPDKLAWSYGFSNVKPICAIDCNTNDKLAKYITKLTNHCIKETTKRYALLYSRKV